MTELVDPLGAVFARAKLSARVFQAGSFCGVAMVPNEPGVGVLHVLRSGRLTVAQSRRAPVELVAPAAFLIARPLAHALSTDRDADLVCAQIVLGGSSNPLERGLPDVLSLDPTQDAALNGVLDLLFKEASSQGSARQAVLDRLVEVAVICLLRHALNRRDQAPGLLAGLAHPTLSRVLTRMHEAPADNWTLERMADEAGLSRSSFAEVFRATVGVAPGEYLKGWRMQLAWTSLKQGRTLKQVAREVGYTSQAALSRALKREFGGAARMISREEALQTPAIGHSGN